MDSGPESPGLFITPKKKERRQPIIYKLRCRVNNAHNFILELEQTIYSLDTMPERFALISENIFFGTNYRQIIHQKYRVIYKISGESVYIMRVVHGAKLIDL